MTLESLERTRNSCNSTGVTSKRPEMNYYDIRKPFQTSWSLEFLLYRFVMSENGLLYNQKALKKLEIPAIPLT